MTIRFHENSNPVKIEPGVRQGDTLSPKLFIATLEYAFKFFDWDNKGVTIDGEQLNNLRFEDDIVLISDNQET